MEKTQPIPSTAAEGRFFGEDGSIQIDYAAEQKLVRKLDLHIMPLIMLLYLFSFLDRVNIGNARLYGLEKDLGLHGNQYQILVSVLFVTYISCELPSNLLVKRFGPSRWISFIALSWGLVATFSGFSQSFGGMLVCRLLLGAFEGGMFPGIVVYLTFFYTKRELALRIGYLFTCSAIAGACGGLLAYAIGYMDDQPSTAKYLSTEERALVLARLTRQTGMTASAQELHSKDVKKGLLDWKVWTFCFAQFGVDTMLYGFSTFLPTIIKGIMPHATSAIVQVLTIPVYSLGAITYLIVGFISDHQQRRGLYCVLFGSVSIVGYIMLISNGGSAVHYAGCFLVACGMYCVIGLPLAWLPSHTPRYGKRTTSIALQAMIGNSAGIMSSFLYPSTEAPRYVKGHAITIAMVAFGVLSFGFMWGYYSFTNNRRAEGKEDHKVAGLSDEEIEELGDDSPRFRYVI
ncbi:hypothetical protein LTR10_017694 [Elasticomyces elasticus]|uniref:Major facilitator superfamily (MFS) profile domain-containing protein n=1 Tax=Exophiala sideris TaxID=1016849 RepID=A0ABR0JBI5_9EURO|nr:hypothetical protein LTR10_017694 [Elasticomyces elasticus]KAK5031057.1 hypothetical protein LTS07_004792 [Exophiala sideris]KAK5038779.1 hypothetical protein LTR13_003810 [Exophiala sideris]KAK5060662.1 hypothetical protein LTR69_005261 [Exophiala sideris]KAK5183575.1 hypothetical protein LTR44_003857 [Eurotiomycetes sp. CCFEE 6388]